jgi:translation initiation factor 1
MKKSNQSGLVYSTEGGRMCPQCRRPVADCVCRATATVPKGDGKVRICRETKGRNGKAVTVIRGLPLQAEALAALGKQLRAACGAGGTAKDGVLEIQGDHCERVLAWLAKEGWPAKMAGG